MGAGWILAGCPMVGYSEDTGNRTHNLKPCPSLSLSLSRIKTPGFEGRFLTGLYLVLQVIAGDGHASVEASRPAERHLLIFDLQ